MRLRSHPLAWLAGHLAWLPAAAFSQQATTLPPRVEITGSPIIEASRSDSFGSLATEVGESQVRDLDAIDLSSALRRTPGVTVSRFNPVGSYPMPGRSVQVGLNLSL